MALTPENVKSFEKLVVLVAPEEEYGTDATPAAADALILSDVQLRPLQADKRTRQFISSVFGNRPSLLSMKRTELTARIELSGSYETADGIPPFDAALMACGRVRTQVAKTAEATIAAAPVGSGSPEGTFTFARTTAYAGVLDRVATLTCTTGGGSGTAKFTVAAPAVEHLAAYSVADVTMTDGQPFALPGGAVITPTVGTSFEAGDTFTIALTAPGVTYRKTSDRAQHGSASIYAEIDGERHRCLGFRGNARLVFPAEDFPYVELAGTGFFYVPSAGSTVEDVTDWTDPDLVESDQTPIRRIFGADVVLDGETAFDLGVEYGLRSRVGRRAVRISNARPTFTMTVEAPDLGDINLFDIANARTRGAIAFQHGMTAGRTIRVDAASVQIDAPQPQNGDGDYLLGLQGECLDSAPGEDDDLVVTFR